MDECKPQSWRDCPGYFVGVAALCASSLLSLAGCTARTNIGVTGEAPADVEHLWITVEEVWFAAEADALPESETGWTRETLSDPIMLDLANVDPDALVPLVTNLSVPAGSYRQLHLGLADGGDRLVDAAQKLGLDFNAQIEVRRNDGTLTKAPLELPVPGAGLTLPVDLSIEGNSGLSNDVEDLTNLAITLDAARDVVEYEAGSSTGYILNPTVVVVDKATGAISGNVDTSRLAAGHAPVFVSVQVPDDARSHQRVVQRRRVAADGSFVLFPLPAAKDGTKQYDVVITCAGAGTVIVRDVPVSAGTDATEVQADPLALTPAATVYADVAQNAGLSAGLRVEFYQRPRGQDTPPYFVDGMSLDPITRRSSDEFFALSAGALAIGTYANGSTIAFESTAPDGSAGAYLVGAAGLYRVTTLSSAPVEIDGTRNSPTLVAVPDVPVVDGGAAGQLTVNVLTPVGRFDAGFVTVSSGHRIMETVSVDALLRNGGGTISIGGLPAGNALAPLGGVPYKVALRAWNSRTAVTTVTVAAASGTATLGDSGTDSLSLQIQ